MSGRSTADYVADLRLRAITFSIDVANNQYLVDAADHLAALDALRPPCPTCSGKQYIEQATGMDSGPTHIAMPCPDCVDGKVSIEQLAATWRAVWEWAPGWPAMTEQIELIDHLRSVWP